MAASPRRTIGRRRPHDGEERWTRRAAPAGRARSRPALPLPGAYGRRPRSGKHAHEPGVLTKELGPSTPQFRNALVNNESLTSVVFDFYGTEAHGGGGKEELGFTIKLTNASVASAELQKLNVKHPDLMK